MQLIEQGFPYTAGLWNKKMVYDFYKGAWTVFHELEKHQQTVEVVLPEELPVYQADHIYQPKVLADWLWGELGDLTDAFDARNGSKCFSKDLKALKHPVIVR